MTEFKHSNKLINEKSPYLLQHAHNPVDWYPWGDEAFEKAKSEDKPVFLSIGYSSCHWCHVMERESFEDIEVAELLNKNFISIKVDREERPDIDHLYMEACTTMTGRGGWPLSLFLTPDKKPFYAGTYFPKTDRYGISGLITILLALSSLWRTEKEKCLYAAEDIVKLISNTDVPKQNDYNAEELTQKAFRELANSFDEEYGGFSSAPKFPTAHNLLFLIRYSLLFHDIDAIKMAETTLNCMAKGGIYDHIGGGFCRYSTDRRFLIPHFEKMMYDNAMLTIAYSEAGAAINRGFFETADHILDYCFKEMQHENGGFYTAQDADSEGTEGKYYVFTPSEINEALGEKDGKVFSSLFDITEKGNFEGKNIPNLIGKTLSDSDKKTVEPLLKKLYTYRKERIPPFKDEKQLASVNGLMLAALGIAGRLSGNNDYLVKAEKTAEFILNNLIKNGRLYASFKDGTLNHPAVSDDYAYVLWGLFELYEATLKPHWLKETLNLADNMTILFKDEQNGALFLSGIDVTDLPLRGKNTTDGALPSGNSVAANVLLRLYGITEKDIYFSTAESIIKSLINSASLYPLGYMHLMSAQLHILQGGIKINIVNGEGAQDFINTVRSFNPFASFTLCGKDYEEINKIVPSLSELKNEEGKATAYVCNKGACYPPATDIDELKNLMSI